MCAGSTVAIMCVCGHTYTLVVILVTCVKYQLLPIYVWSYTCPCGNFGHIYVKYQLLPICVWSYMCPCGHFGHICAGSTVANMCVVNVIHVPTCSSNIPSLIALCSIGQQCVVQTDAVVQSPSSYNPELENTPTHVTQQFCTE